MPSKEIVIEIDENGDCSVEGKGFSGPECDKNIQEIERALGERTSVQHKPEYRQRVTNNNRERTCR